jgi:hypothetical protein
MSPSICGVVDPKKKRNPVEKQGKFEQGPSVPGISWKIQGRKPPRHVGFYQPEENP